MNMKMKILNMNLMIMKKILLNYLNQKKIKLKMILEQFLMK